MEIYSVFVIVVGGEDWEWADGPGGPIRILDDERTDDFLLGTFSSPELAEADLAKFLLSYEVDDPDALDRFGWDRPIRGVTLWKTELDAGQAEGEFVKWMRGDAEHPLEYPYK